MQIYNLSQLQQVEITGSLMEKLEEGFMAYSENKVIQPPVGHIPFSSPPGDLHIKGAAGTNLPYFAVKMAACFPENASRNLASIQSLNLLFDQSTGVPIALFLDQGYLTHLRTALAGAICAKYFAPKNIQAIGILGSGQQAYYQLKYLKKTVNCKTIWIWGRNSDKVRQLISHPDFQDCRFYLAHSPQEVAQHAQLIVTTTASEKPLLHARDIQPGTHLTAVGADRPGKQELHPDIFTIADRLIVDSQSQCSHHGESLYALEAGLILIDQLEELGSVIAKQTYRKNDLQITLADLTGLGVQDLMVCHYFHENLKKNLC